MRFRAYYDFTSCSISGLEDDETGPDEIIVLKNDNTTAKTTTSTTTEKADEFSEIEWADFGSYEDDVSISDISKNDHATKRTSTSTIKPETSSKIDLIISLALFN